MEKRTYNDGRIVKHGDHVKEKKKNESGFSWRGTVHVEKYYDEDDETIEDEVYFVQNRFGMTPISGNFDRYELLKRKETTEIEEIVEQLQEMLLESSQTTEFQNGINGILKQLDYLKTLVE